MSSSSYASSTQLKACPNKPNCVSTQAIDEHAVAPFILTKTPSLDIPKLIELIKNMGVRINTNTDGQHLQAEFTSRIFGFVDDLDLILDNNTIHVRSASRTGYYDFGVNRRRVEKLRNILKKEGFIQ